LATILCNMISKHIGVIASSIVLDQNYLIDDYPGAGLALSVRRLTSVYVGPCIKVQRTSDNTQQDIGFTSSGDLDVAALESFCAATDGYVVTWYDQSGNGYEFTVESGNYQIVDDGDVLLKDGVPAIYFVGSAFLQETVDRADLLGSSQVYAISVQSGTGGTSFALADDGGFSVVIGLNWVSGSTPVSISLFNGFSSYLYKDNTVTTNANAIVETVVQNASTGNVYIDGSVMSEVLSNLTSFSPSGTNVFYIGSDGFGYNETIQEVIVYPSNQSSNRSAIYTNVSTYFN
jgi:hypothetical protein